MKLKWSLILALLLCTLAGWSQPCSIQVSTPKVCLGNTVSFTANPLSAQDSVYAWSFGDASTSTQATPTNQYAQAGNFTVTLRIYKKGGTFCDATPVVVKVLPKPVAAFQLLGNDTQCFNSNKFIINDLSGPGTSNAPLRRRIFVYGDGAFLQQNPPFSNPLVHSYTNNAGGTYPVVLEVEDTNGCLNQVVDTFVVTKELTAQFLFIEEVKCGQSFVRFVNNTEGVLDGLTVKWDFGDGNSTTHDSTVASFGYTYHGDTLFWPTLYVKDKSGCSDTLLSPLPVHTFIPDSTIIISNIDKRCFSGNIFSFTNKTKLDNGNAYYWELKKPEIFYQRDSLQKNINSASFPTCGVYDIKLYFSHMGCRFETDTQVVVYGPEAKIAGNGQVPLNWVQCGSHDTVKFRLDDVNCYYQNNNVRFFWDFADPYAPACTTDTKNNINVGINCRYSVDSILVNHRYSQPNQFCYQVKMWAEDTDRHCADTGYVRLRLSYPKVGRDSTVFPPRARAYATSRSCSQIPVVINWADIEPSCGAEKVWIKVDSTCPDNRWMEVDSLGIRSTYEVQEGDYCSSDTLLTFGIVARNGRDALGNYCYDTAYYRYIRKKPPTGMVIFAVLDDADLCVPHKVKVYTPDSIRKDLAALIYNFGDNTPDTIVNFGINDTIVPKVYHNYYKSGSFRISLKFISRDNCTAEDDVFIKIGNLASLKIQTPLVCNNAFAQFQARIRYQNDTFLRYWSDTSRFLAGKEELYWNFGDNSTWYQGYESMQHKYTQPGNYKVKLAFKDSLGLFCFDTLESPAFNVLVSAVKSVATSSADTFYCAPSIVTFTDSSYALYGNSIPDYNLITTRFWQFDAGKGTSTLKQPGIFYQENGVFKATLYAESVYGCSDTVTKQIVVLGPTPKFVITNDTFGCVPYTVKLRNTTGQQLKNWIWYFNDPAGTLFSTAKDTDVTFTYNTPGTYRIDLLGEDRIYNPTTGSFKTCSQTFPYLENANSFHIRQVTALPYDTLRINIPDTVCVDVPFVAKSSGTNQINNVRWSWGDTSAQQTQLYGVNTSHQYDSTGAYLIKLDPVLTANWQCVLPTQKSVYAQSPKADFNVVIKNYPEIQFPNLSTQAKRFWWSFGDPSSTQNNSTDVTGKHTYTATDSIFTVCLSAFDERDCMDSVCKVISVRAHVKIPNVFTPDNNDGANDAFDIDIEGYEKYELYIYNRWGTMVYERKKDGINNDGINWNGKDKNTGAPCPEGVYYVIFKYKLVTEPDDQVYHGTVTLIR